MLVYLRDGSQWRQEDNQRTWRRLTDDECQKFTQTNPTYWHLKIQTLTKTQTCATPPLTGACWEKQTCYPKHHALLCGTVSLNMNICQLSFIWQPVIAFIQQPHGLSTDLSYTQNTKHNNRVLLGSAWAGDQSLSITLQSPSHYRVKTKESSPVQSLKTTLQILSHYSTKQGRAVEFSRWEHN